MEQDILFEPEGKSFLLSGKPFKTVPFGESITRHIKTLTAIKSLIGGKYGIQMSTLSKMIRQSSYNDIHEGDVKDLIEQGLLSVNNHKIRANEDYLCPPSFADPLKCDIVAQRSSSVCEMTTNIDEAIGYLRLHMAFLWGVTPHEFSLIGMPFYRVNVGGDSTFDVSAWRGMSFLLGTGSLLERHKGGCTH